MDIAVYLQRIWKSLGLNVEIDLQTGGMLRQLRNQGKLGMFRGSWIADYPDAENYLSCFYTGYFSPNGPNYTHFSNKQFDQLFEDIAFGVVNSPEKERIRKVKIQQANQILADEAPVIVLYYDRSLRLMQKNVQSLSNDAINRLKLNSVEVVKN
jgi:peptide/nickel transport system substrate-binding protein